MGVTVAIPATAFINPLARALAPVELADSTSLPGRSSQEGFIGGTAIINGLTANDPANTTGLGIVAEDIFVEPAENVLLGEVSGNSCFAPTCDAGGLEISGVSRFASKIREFRPGRPSMQMDWRSILWLHSFLATPLPRVISWVTRFTISRTRRRPDGNRLNCRAF